MTENTLPLSPKSDSVDLAALGSTVPAEPKPPAPLLLNAGQRFDAPSRAHFLSVPIAPHAAAGPYPTAMRPATQEEAAHILGRITFNVRDELVQSLRDMVDWLDDGNRQLSDACRADVQRAKAILAKVERA